MIKTYLIFFITLLYSCSTQKKSKLVLCFEDIKTSNAINMSFKDLYNSKEIEGKKINIEGFFAFNFEDIALYPGNFKQKAIWLDLNDKFVQNDTLLSKINGKKITVTGTVDLSRKGHLNYYFCTLYNITCITEK